MRVWLANRVIKVDIKKETALQSLFIVNL